MVLVAVVVVVVVAVVINRCCSCTVVRCGAVERPKVVRRWCVFHMLTSKCAPRHSGVHFLTSQRPKWSERGVPF